MKRDTEEANTLTYRVMTWWSIILALPAVVTVVGLVIASWTATPPQPFFILGAPTATLFLPPGIYFAAVESLRDVRSREISQSRRERGLPRGAHASRSESG